MQLRGITADANFDTGELATGPKSHLMKITGNVVTISSWLQIIG